MTDCTLKRHGIYSRTTTGVNAKSDIVCAEGIDCFGLDARVPRMADAGLQRTFSSQSQTIVERLLVAEEPAK